MPDLEDRTRSAIGKLDVRLKDVELICRQVEDLMPLVKAVASLERRVMRIENTGIHWRDQREAIYDNEVKIAQEMAFVRERLLTLEATASPAALTGDHT